MKNFAPLFSIKPAKIHAISLPQITPRNAISLHLGYPDPQVFPYKGILKASEQVLKNEINSLQYCEEVGDLNLRKAVYRKYYETKNTINEDNILITQGTTDALEISIKLFIEPKDCIITEAPSYLWALRVFKMADAHIVSIPVDSDGMIVEKLETSIKVLKRENINIKFIYVIPDFQNPSGVSMSLSRRKSILAVANQHDLLIFEDNPYCDLRYSGKPIPSLLELDNHGVVIQARTFSKTIGPGIRLGWIVGPDTVISGLIRMKQTGSCTLVSKIAARFIVSDAYDTNIEFMKKHYGKKCFRMVDAMKNYFPEDVSWYPPEGGFYVWVKVPHHYPVRKIYNNAAENGVLFLKGSDFYSQKNDCNDIRLSFSYETPDRIEEGINKLAKEFEKVRS